ISVYQFNPNRTRQPINRAKRMLDNRRLVDRPIQNQDENLLFIYVSETVRRQDLSNRRGSCGKAEASFTNRSSIQRLEIRHHGKPALHSGRQWRRKFIDPLSGVDPPSFSDLLRRTADLKRRRARMGIAKGNHRSGKSGPHLLDVTRNPLRRKGNYLWKRALLRRGRRG